MSCSAERVIFLDRDGVINRRLPGHVRSRDELEFLPGALRAIRRLHSLGERVVVVTNQSVVGRGLIDTSALSAIHQRLVDEIDRNGGHIERIYACPHTPGDGCECRKPRIGLLLRAAQDLGIELERCILIGDSTSDVEAALAAGCAAIFVGDAADACFDADVPAVADLWEAVCLLSARTRSHASPPRSSVTA